MKNEQINFDDIQDRHMDEMIRLAFQQADAMEARENEEDLCPVDREHAKAVFDAFMRKAGEESKKEKKETRKRLVRRLVPRIIEIAACVVLILGIATPFAVANVEAIRVKMMELLIDIREDHTELRFSEDDDREFYVPADWRGEYYPSYIPEGYRMTDMSRVYHRATFENEQGKRIRYSEYFEEDSVDINSEGASLSYHNIKGNSSLVLRHPDNVIVIWAVEDRYFVLEAETSKEEALKIAESVRKIK